MANGSRQLQRRSLFAASTPSAALSRTTGPVGGHRKPYAVFPTAADLKAAWKSWSSGSVQRHAALPPEMKNEKYEARNAKFETILNDQNSNDPNNGSLSEGYPFF
jgi:hypothetical protein